MFFGGGGADVARATAPYVRQLLATVENVIQLKKGVIQPPKKDSPSPEMGQTRTAS